jgi:hypothetical protein
VKGESVFAFVVCRGERPTGDVSKLVDELRKWVTQELGALARPDDIRFADNLPKTRSGKIMRRLLRSVARGDAITQDVSTLENPSILDQLRGVDTGSTAKLPTLAANKKVAAKKTKASTPAQPARAAKKPAKASKPSKRSAPTAAAKKAKASKAAQPVRAATKLAKASKPSKRSAPTAAAKKAKASRAAQPARTAKKPPKASKPPRRSAPAAASKKAKASRTAQPARTAKKRATRTAAKKTARARKPTRKK